MYISSIGLWRSTGNFYKRLWIWSLWTPANLWLWGLSPRPRNLWKLEQGNISPATLDFIGKHQLASRCDFHLFLLLSFSPLNLFTLVGNCIPFITTESRSRLQSTTFLGLFSYSSWPLKEPLPLPLVSPIHGNTMSFWILEAQIHATISQVSCTTTWLTRESKPLWIMNLVKERKYRNLFSQQLKDPGFLSLSSLKIMHLQSGVWMNLWKFFNVENQGINWCCQFFTRWNLQMSETKEVVLMRHFLAISANSRMIWTKF